jgi:ketopantoate reductase
MEMFRRILEEVRTVAATEGAKLEEDVMDRHEALHGSVIRRGLHDVPVPVCEAVYANLRYWAVQNERSSG